MLDRIVVALVALEALRRLSRRAGARQREHRAVLQPEVVRVLGEALLREIRPRSAARLAALRS